jgi:LasA protease
VQNDGGERPYSAYTENFTGEWINNERFVYHSGLVDFDLHRYLETNAPHLSQYTDYILHWSGYYSINPKILLTLIEMQSGLISQGLSSEQSQDPLSGVASEQDFSAQVTEVLSELYHDFYVYQEKQQQRLIPANDSVNAATYALLNLLRADQSKDEFAFSVELKRAGFRDTFEQLFQTDLADESNATENTEAEALPPTGFVRLPWKTGESWHFGGVHTNTGGSVGAMSSLDFYDDPLAWGGDTSSFQVVASHAGTVTVFSSCSVRITASNG